MIETIIIILLTADILTNIAVIHSNKRINEKLKKWEKEHG